MGFFFANPLGFLVLSGIGGIVLIHLLRRKSRRIVVSTLFLVQRAHPSGEGGKRFRRLRNSLPLWVQILVVVALAWLAAQPRWIDSTSVQTVVAVFDSSASMSAFREKTLQVAASELRRMKSAAARTQWIFLRSDGSRMALGSELSDVLAEAERAWRPTLGTHDVNEALRLARTLAGEKGSIVYFTDHQPETEKAFDVSWVAVGEPIDNAGFLGAGIQDGRWSALLKNFGAKTRDVRWRIAGEAEWRTQHLDPGATTDISGELPAGMDKLTLELEDDRFVLDNRLPLVRPQSKTLAIRVAENEGFRALFEQMLRIAEPLSIATDGGQDVSFEAFNPLTPRAFAGAAIVFAEDSGMPGKLLSGTIFAENHSLMESLNWQGLSRSRHIRYQLSRRRYAASLAGRASAHFPANAGQISTIDVQFRHPAIECRAPARVWLAHISLPCHAPRRKGGSGGCECRNAPKNFRGWGRDYTRSRRS